MKKLYIQLDNKFTRVQTTSWLQQTGGLNQSGNIVHVSIFFWRAPKQKVDNDKLGNQNRLNYQRKIFHRCGEEEGVRRSQFTTYGRDSSSHELKNGEINNTSCQIETQQTFEDSLDHLVPRRFWHFTSRTCSTVVKSLLFYPTDSSTPWDIQAHSYRRILRKEWTTFK